MRDYHTSVNSHTGCAGVFAQRNESISLEPDDRYKRCKLGGGKGRAKDGRKDVLFESLLNPRNNFTNCKPSQSGNRSKGRKERIARAQTDIRLLCLLSSLLVMIINSLHYSNEIHGESGGRDRGSEETGNLVRRSENKRIMIIVLGSYIFLGQD